MVKGKYLWRNRDPFDSLVPEIAKVHRWPSCEVNGLILVWFHCEGKEPEWTVPEQEEITSGEWVYRGRTEHFINAHIQVGADNPAGFPDISNIWWSDEPCCAGNPRECSRPGSPGPPAHAEHDQRSRPAPHPQQSLAVPPARLEGEGSVSAAKGRRRTHRLPQPHRGRTANIVGSRELLYH